MTDPVAPTPAVTWTEWSSMPLREGADARSIRAGVLAIADATSALATAALDGRAEPRRELSAWCRRVGAPASTTIDAAEVTAAGLHRAGFSWAAIAAWLGLTSAQAARSTAVFLVVHVLDRSAGLELWLELETTSAGALARSPTHLRVHGPRPVAAMPAPAPPTSSAVAALRRDTRRPAPVRPPPSPRERAIALADRLGTALHERAAPTLAAELAATLERELTAAPDEAIARDVGDILYSRLAVVGRGQVHRSPDVLPPRLAQALRDAWDRALAHDPYW